MSLIKNPDLYRQTTEKQLIIKVIGDKLGHYTAFCVAMDRAGDGNTLEFEIGFDQTEMPAILEGLDAILQAFPVKGSPSDRE